MIKLGRIAYANMAPVFYRVDADIEEVLGVPTELNQMLLDGELDTAPISSIEYARHADTLRLLPRLCVSSEGAVESGGAGDGPKPAAPIRCRAAAGELQRHRRQARQRQRAGDETASGSERVTPIHFKTSRREVLMAALR